MGRLQRYLRQLSEEEWQVIHKEMRASLGKGTVALAERLRQTLRTLNLNSAEREQAQRIERWLWRRAVLERTKNTALTQPTPIEWRIIGAELFYQRGLVKDAYSLLSAPVASPVQRLTLEVQRLYWQVQEGDLAEAQKTVDTLLRLTRHIRGDLERQKMELMLVRILREYGSGDPPPARRLLQRITKLIEHRPVPEGKDLRAYAERNLRLLHGIVKSDPAAIQTWRIETLEAPEALPLLLNSWLSLLLENAAIARITNLIQQLPTPLYPQYEAVASHLILLTILLYSSPAFLREKLRFIYGRQPSFPSPPFPERELMKAQLLWLAGEPKAAHIVLDELRTQIRDKYSFQSLQVEMLYLIAGIDARAWHAVLKTAEGLERRLRRMQVGTAPLLRQLIRQSRSSRLSLETLRSANQRWRALLRDLPTEEKQWHLTILPDWLSARERGCYVWEYRAAVTRATSTELNNLWATVAKVFQVPGQT